MLLSSTTQLQLSYRLYDATRSHLRSVGVTKTRITPWRSSPVRPAASAVASTYTPHLYSTYIPPILPTPLHSVRPSVSILQISLPCDLCLLVPLSPVHGVVTANSVDVNELLVTEKLFVGQLLVVPASLTSQFRSATNLPLFCLDHQFSYLCTHKRCA